MEPLLQLINTKNIKMPKPFIDIATKGYVDDDINEIIKQSTINTNYSTKLNKIIDKLFDEYELSPDVKQL